MRPITLSGQEIRPQVDGLATSRQLAWPADALVALGFALATFVTRWPMRTEMLAFWDSILYARALDDFNVVAHQPQPPGYLFYVLAGRLARWLGATTANEAYVWVSQISAALMVGMIYLVARALFGRAAGLAAGLFAATAIVPWAYSGVAYPYTLLALGSTVLAGLCWALRRRAVAPWLVAAAYGILAGFRQDLLYLLGPLFLLSLGRRPVRDYVLVVASGVLASLTWLVPSSLASGGLDRYIGAFLRQTVLVERDTSLAAGGVADAVWNLRHLYLYLVIKTLRLAVIPLAGLVVAAVVRPSRLLDARAQHLLVWILPGALFYSLVHIGDAGYVLSIAPPLLIAAGGGTVAVSQWLGRWPGWRRLGLRLPLALVLTPTYLVWALLTGVPALENDRYVFHTGLQFSRLSLHCHDAAIAGSVAYVRDHLSPEGTVLVASGYYQHARHYLPRYETWFYEPGSGPELRRTVPPGVRTIVAFGPRMQTHGQPNEERVPAGCDVTLSFFHVQPGQTVIYRPDELWIE